MFCFRFKNVFFTSQTAIVLYVKLSMTTKRGGSRLIRLYFIYEITTINGNSDELTKFDLFAEQHSRRLNVCL